MCCAASLITDSTSTQVNTFFSFNRLRTKFDLTVAVVLVFSLTMAPLPSVMARAPIPAAPSTATADLGPATAHV